MAARAPAGGARRKEVEDANNTWNMQLMAAVLKADIAEATSLVAKGAAVNHTVAEPALKGQTVTPFIAVALKGAGSLVGLSGNPNPVAAGVMPATDMVNTLQWLCQNGANPNAQLDGNKGTIFHHGIRHDLHDMLDKLLSNRLVISEEPPVVVEVVTAEVPKGKGALKKTTEAVAAPVVVAAPPPPLPALVEDGPKPAPPPVKQPRDLFDLTVQDENGLTAFQLAINLAKIDGGRLLLKHGVKHHFSAAVDGLRTQAARACFLGDTQTLEVLLNLGDDPWQVDDAGQTLLHTATHAAVVDMLLDRGVSPNVLNAAGQTPLSYLVSHRPNALDCIDTLLARGADTSVGDATSGLTPLMHAIIGYATDVCKKLITDGKVDLNVKDAMGCTALHWAATARGKGILEQLVQLEGIELNAVDKLGQTALHRACHVHGRAEYAALLLAKDAVDVNITDANGNTALHVAVLRNNEAALKALITRVDQSTLPGAPVAAPAAVAAKGDAKKPPGKKGAPAVEQAQVSKLNVDCENKQGRTALQIASMHNFVDLVKALTAVGANVNRKSQYGNLVHEAVIKLQPELVHLYAKKGAGVNDRNGDDKTPLHLAVEVGSLACVVALLDCGAHVDEQESESLHTPLHLACGLKLHEIRDELIRAGANVSLSDAAVRTPLHMACAVEDAETVRSLLERGAWVDASDVDGSTPLHIACANDALDCMELLIAAGAHVWARDDRQRAPLHVAVACGALRCTERLCAMIVDFHTHGVPQRPPSPTAQDRPASKLGQRRPPTPAELAPSATIEHDGVVMAIDGAAARAKHLRAEAKRSAAEADWRNALRLQDADGRYPLALAGLSGSAEVARVLLRTHNLINAKSREAAGLPPRPPSVPLRTAPMDL